MNRTRRRQRSTTMECRIRMQFVKRWPTDPVSGDWSDGVS